MLQEVNLNSQRKDNGAVGLASLIIAPPFLLNSKLRPLRALPETSPLQHFPFVFQAVVSLYSSLFVIQSYLLCVFENCVKIFAVLMAPSFIFTITTDLLFMHISLLSYQWVIEGEGKQMHVLCLQYSKIAFSNVWPCIHQCSTLRWPLCSARIQIRHLNFNNQRQFCLL